MDEKEQNVRIHTNEGTVAVNAKGDIFYAASEGNIKSVRQFLDSGIKATVADYDQRTPLHIACVAGHKEVVELLLNRGANVNARDVHEWTPLDEATRNHREEVAIMVRGRGGKNGCETMIKPLRHKQYECLESVAAGDLDNVKNLIGSIGGVNFSDYDGRTPLHLAVAEGHYELAKWLIDYQPEGLANKKGNHGANKSAKDRWGSTPADEAKRHQVRSGQDKMTPLFFSEERHGESAHSLWSSFSIFYCVAEIVLIILLCFCVEYSAEANAPGSDLVAGGHGHGADSHSNWLTLHDSAGETYYMNSLNQVTQYEPPAEFKKAAEMMKKYPQYMDVHVMIFVGFGFLMTFLKKHCYNSLGLTFLVSAFVIQWHILCGGFFEHWIVTGEISKLYVSLDTMIFADFACGAVLITYGVLLGKVSPFQLLFIAMLEIIFFSVNEAIGIKLMITDIGGSMVVHMFGAFFGLSASLVMKRKAAMGNKENAAVYHSDMFAMIGTVFLWMFWPSFNGAMASENRQMRVTINTVLSLAGSCMAGFVASYVMRREKKFDMVDVQNATLAGGVAMGTCADLIVQPGPSVLIGAVSGVISVFGYVHIQPLLEKKLGLHDTCGVNNLHGMPSIVGAFAGVLVIGFANTGHYGDHTQIIFPAIADGQRDVNTQAGYQLLFTVITLAISMTGGAITGTIMNGLGKLLEPFKDNRLFTDSQHWEVPGYEHPYYFDHRGEISRDPKKDDNISKDITLKLEGLIEKVKAMEKRSQQGSAFEMNVGTFFEGLVEKMSTNKPDRKNQ